MWLQSIFPAPSLIVLIFLWCILNKPSCILILNTPHSFTPLCLPQSLCLKLYFWPANLCMSRHLRQNKKYFFFNLQIPKSSVFFALTQHTVYTININDHISTWLGLYTHTLTFLNYKISTVGARFHSSVCSYSPQNIV